MLTVNSLKDLSSEVRFYDLLGRPVGRLPTAGLCTIGGPAGRFDRPEVFFTQSSPLHPPCLYLHDRRTGATSPFEPSDVEFDASPFACERASYPSADGTRVPLLLVHKRGLPKDGRNPTWLTAYGGFGIAKRPSYSAATAAWIERGGVVATAYVRGGGEYGTEWHAAGIRAKKENTFADFIAAAEHLIDQGYASPQTLGIRGASHGALVAAVAMERRPDLFAAAVLEDGLMDMLRFHRFTGGALWIAEYGSPNEPEAFAALLEYSPLHNIGSGHQGPAVLASTADHDDRVVPCHSFKFVAALQAARGSGQPVLLRVESDASHGYRPLPRRLAELADYCAFGWHHLTSASVRPRPSAAAE